MSVCPTGGRTESIPAPKIPRVIGGFLLIEYLSSDVIFVGTVFKIHLDGIDLFEVGVGLRIGLFLYIIDKKYTFIYTLRNQ
ncbi:MAG: hypothetical protein CMI52_01080 [Parcubacteria group bacterium]|nr:hypothetical protein [Parcubacteria group bacterium]